MSNRFDTLFTVALVAFIIVFLITVGLWFYEKAPKRWAYFFTGFALAWIFVLITLYYLKKAADAVTGVVKTVAGDLRNIRL